MRKLIPLGPTVFFAIGAWLILGQPGAQAQSNECSSPLSDIYYSKYTVVEGAVFTETNPGPSVLETSNAYFFIAMVSLKTNYTAGFADLIITNGPFEPMREEDSRLFIYEAQFTNFAELSAAYPSGAYQFIVSNDVTTVPIPKGLVLANAPTLTDYAGAQSIDPTKDFTLKWNAFTNGTANDLIDVDVTGFGQVFEAPVYGCPGHLDGKATSVVIPANTLTSNMTYRFDISFVKILTIDTNSTPFVALLGGTEAETEGIISTGSGSAAPAGPVVSNVLELPNGKVRFDVSTTPATTYLIQSNPNLTNDAGWTTLLTTNAAGTEVSFTNKPTGSARFYRVEIQ